MKKINFLFALLFLWPMIGFAEYSPGQKVVEYRAEIQPQTLHPGERLRLVIKAELEHGWHIYSVTPQGEDAPPPTQVNFPLMPFELDGPQYETKAIVQYDRAIGLTLAYHEGKAEFYQNFTVPLDMPPGEYELTLTLTSQACDERICLPPQEFPLNVKYRLEEGPIRTEYSFAERSIALVNGGFGGTGAGGLFAFLGLALMMGLASLLMPCVFPMIPITVTYFSKQAEGSQTRLVKLASLFGLGIIGTYTGTGLLLSSLFGAAAVSQLATNPYVNLAIALLFIFFAFSLIGLFNLEIPASWQNYFDHKARKLGGATGVLLMGFTFTLTAFTCTVQFVGTLMIAAAQGEWIWPLIGMLVYSTVFAFPFVLLALAPGMIRRVQGKSGEWMGRSKVVLGILELMASLKFLSNADLVWQSNYLSRDLTLQMWIALLGGIILYLAWTGLRPVINKSSLQWGVVGLFTLLLIMTSKGLGDHSLGGLIDSLLPPPSGMAKLGGDFVTKEEITAMHWYGELGLAIEEAQKTGKPIFVEFTGYTCVNCRWMEQNVMAQRRVHDLLAGDFILVKLYTDGGDRAKENLEFQIHRFQTVALPLYAVLNSEGVTRESFIGLTPEVDEFVEFLQKGLQKKE